MTTSYFLTALALIGLPLAFNGVFFALGRSFSYPDILRQPTAHILTRFAAGGRRLVVLWYVFALTAILTIPMTLLMAGLFGNHPLAVPSAILGVLSGLVQAMGLLRWPLLVPMLAARYGAPDTSPEGREAITVVFEAFHQYVGVGVGEHLGYILTAAWTLSVAVMMWPVAGLGAVMGVLGIVSAVGILAGLAEPFGWKPAGAMNAISYLVWSAWLMLAGVALLSGVMVGA
jgi:hypothetical protein